MISLSTRFDPQQMSVWSSQTGLGFFSDPQEAYRLAKPFLLDQMRELLENDWIEGNKTSEQDVLFHICKPAGTTGCSTRLEIILPETFDSFLDPSKGDMWRAVFENPQLFKVGYQKQERADLHPDLYLGFSRRRPMLSDNIFHIIQVLAPGLLTLQYQFLSGELRIKLSRVFPRRIWMVHNHATLAEVMGWVEPLLLAADNQNIAYLEERESHQGGANSSPVLKDSRHNLPSPLIQLENLRSLQEPDPATLACRFDPQQMSVWSNQTDLLIYSEAERQDRYQLAKPFLRETMKHLLGKGWQEGEKNSDRNVLFHIYKPNKFATLPREIILPDTFDSFLDPSKADIWRTIFENPEVFKVQCDKQKGEGLHPDPYLCGSPRPLPDIFYILQVLAPGMLVLQIEYQLGDTRVKASRALPRASWIKHNYLKLGIEVVGGIEALVSAANDQKIAFLEDRRGQPGDNSTRVSNNRPRNLPFPVALIQLRNLVSLQTLDPETQNKKEASSDQTAAEAPAINPTNVISKNSEEDTIGSSSSTASKDKRNKAPKKKKAPPRKQPRYRIIEGAFIPRGSYGYEEPLDWSVCDKDCGWCGRCQLVEY